MPKLLTVSALSGQRQPKKEAWLADERAALPWISVSFVCGWNRALPEVYKEKF